MTLTVYATTDQLDAWLAGTDVCVPANAARQLRSATFIIARAINESPYDPSVVVDEVRQDATCAQVTAWIVAGIDPSSGGLSNTAPVKSKSNDGASIDYDTSLSASVTAFQARQTIANGLAPEAAAILFDAGLLYEPVPLFDDPILPESGLFVSELGLVGGRHGRWPFVIT